MILHVKSSRGMEADQGAHERCDSSRTSFCAGKWPYSKRKFRGLKRGIQEKTVRAVVTVNGKRGVITDESSASLRGQPVVILDGVAHRAGDLLSAEVRLVWNSAPGQRLLVRWNQLCEKAGN